MIYDIGKQVEIPCQYYRSLSGSISLRGASSWLSHWLLLWLIETWMPRDESQMNQSIKFFDTYLQCSESSATNIQLMPDHHYSHLAQGCRSRCLTSQQWRIWHSTMPYHRSYYHGLRREFRRAHFPIIQILMLAVVFVLCCWLSIKPLFQCLSVSKLCNVILQSENGILTLSCLVCKGEKRF